MLLYTRILNQPLIQTIDLTCLGLKHIPATDPQTRFISLATSVWISKRNMYTNKPLYAMILLIDELLTYLLNVRSKYFWNFDRFLSTVLTQKLVTVLSCSLVY